MSIPLKEHFQIFDYINQNQGIWSKLYLYTVMHISTATSTTTTATTTTTTTITTTTMKY